jgi:hypothetical protein
MATITTTKDHHIFKNGLCFLNFFANGLCFLKIDSKRSRANGKIQPILFCGHISHYASCTAQNHLAFSISQLQSGAITAVGSVTDIPLLEIFPVNNHGSITPFQDSGTSRLQSEETGSKEPMNLLYHEIQEVVGHVIVPTKTTVCLLVGCVTTTSP